MYHSGGELSVSWNQLEIRVWKFFYVKVYYGEIQVEAIQVIRYFKLFHIYVYCAQFSHNTYPFQATDPIFIEIS